MRRATIVGHAARWGGHNPAHLPRRISVTGLAQEPDRRVGHSKGC
jgi:hypothetical protein